MILHVGKIGCCCLKIMINLTYLYFVLFCAFMCVIIINGECWTTGCQLNTWAVRGCEQYGMEEVGRKLCNNGLMYSCCTPTVKYEEKEEDVCWETGCQLDSWTIKGCEEYHMVTVRSRPCDNGHHYYCCYANATAKTTTLPTVETKISQHECGFNNGTQLKIYGGDNAQLGDWPWMVVLGVREVEAKYRITKWPCAGTLISDKHILSAAHCFSHKNKQQINIARLGEFNLDPNVDDVVQPIDIGIEKIIVHESYDGKRSINDIALVELESLVKFNDYIQPICLPDGTPKITNSTLTVAGWGTTADDAENTVLKQVSVPVVKNKVCKRLYPSLTIDQRVICAGDLKGGRDSCQGDSGGPLMLKMQNRHYLVGIVSYGMLCAEPNQPGIYTRVIHYKKWIIRKMKKG